MFDIECKGGNDVVINTKKSAIVIDPNVTMLGLKQFKISGMIEAITEKDFLVKDDNVVIEGAGEYEVGGLLIYGTAVKRYIDDDKDPHRAGTIYKIVCDGLTIAIIGNANSKTDFGKVLADGNNTIDVLIIPVGGGGYTIDYKDAAKIVKELEPKVVIPVHYKEDGINYEVPQDSVDLFIKELSVDVEDAGSKFKIKSAESLPASLTVVKISK
jgi:L-ascorbate metabolism protein UlaG (beta-lactamase superfamily)